MKFAVAVKYSHFNGVKLLNWSFFGQVIVTCSNANACCSMRVSCVTDCVIDEHTPSFCDVWFDEKKINAPPLPIQKGLTCGPPVLSSFIDSTNEGWKVHLISRMEGHDFQRWAKNKTTNPMDGVDFFPFCLS